MTRSWPRSRCRRHPTRRPPLALLLGLLLGATVTACGSGSNDPATPPGASADTLKDSGGSAGAEAAGGSQMQEEILAFYQCLRDNGLDVADPEREGMIDLKGIDPNDFATRAIVDECSAEHLSDGGPASGGVGSANADSLVDFAQCMRDNGVDMPDPTAEGALNMPEDIDPNSPEFQDAVATCRQHLEGGVRVTG